jgi:hypothetical protein
VLVTRRSGGGVQTSPVLVGVDEEGRLVISTRDHYRRAMEQEQRVLVRVSIDKVGPTRAG